jgi:hypothetical protein
VQSLDPADVGAELVLFTHALDESGGVAGQEDRLDAPAWDWEAGDVVAQIHRFALPGDAEPGAYPLQVGAYRRGQSGRLPVLVDGQPVDDRILLRPLEVRQQ